MPLPRFDKLPPEKRRTILDAAASEFAQHGYDGASFNRIIAAAGISKGAMYYYFEDKGDAYGAVLDEMMDRVESAMQGMPAPTDRESFWAILAEGLGRLEMQFFEDPQIAALMRSLYSRGPGDLTYLRLIERSRGWIRQLLVVGQSLGATRDDVPLDLLTEIVTAMMAALDQWFDRAMDTMPMEELLVLSPKSLELMRDLLEPKPR
ncbi:MAG: TetR/AcrR family transcriptional regulator [Sandaracinaceae bacterium]|nr:TetR/AcrR family transcriptional regulator [Sandaracinaceae bacterium]